jgi:hypothetical protein
MTWKKDLVGWLTSLTLGAIVAAIPAAAAQVKRFTDSQGVIHITNGAGPGEISKTTSDLPGSTEPKDKNDKLRLYYERRGELLSAPPETKRPKE